MTEVEFIEGDPPPTGCSPKWDPSWPGAETLAMADKMTDGGPVQGSRPTVLLPSDEARARRCPTCNSDEPFYRNKTGGKVLGLDARCPDDWHVR